MQKVLSLFQGSQFKLKLFLWLVFLTMALVCGVTWFTWLMVENFFSVKAEIDELPMLTRLLFATNHAGAWLLLLLPWFLYAVAGVLKPEVSVETCLRYAISAMLAKIVILLMSLAGFFMAFQEIDDRIGTLKLPNTSVVSTK